MSGECTVTPGLVWSQDPVTDARLNQAANPVVRVDEDAIGERELNIPAVAPLIIGGTILDNWFRNPGFCLPQTGEAASLTPGARRNTAAAGWYHGASGVAPLSVIRAVSASTGSTERLELVGSNAGNCTWWIGQSFGKEEGQLLYNRTVTIEIDIANDTLQTVTPRCRIRTWATADDASTGAQVYDATATGAVTTVGQGVTSRLAWTLQMSGAVDPSQGFDVEFSVAMVPTLSGRIVRFGRASLTVSAGPVSYSAAVPRHVDRLSIGTAPTVSDDISKGWMVGDIRRVGLAATWIMVDNGTGVAKWRLLGGNPSASVATSTPASITTVIPVDDTIPQSSEGDKVLELSFTPLNLSKLRFEISGMVDLSTNGYVTLAVFRDSEPNAVYAAVVAMDAALRPRAIHCSFELTPVTTNAQIYSVRVGPSTGTARWLRLNSGNVFGGVMQGSLRIEQLINT